MLCWFLPNVNVNQPSVIHMPSLQSLPPTSNPLYFFFLFNVYFYLCVYLTMPGLGCVVRSWFPDRESNPLPPALGVQSLSPWTTREFWVYSL